ncbi:hypothetical protein PC129_g18230 [Phytophthora cactorum]|uniref:Prolyl 4-hydroxylase alpha subunit Fe(2+) 2OG dioxygenase domain-containing protein n=3 Tax=Phytophthora cactorum TaxID=29920 RepID=A0A8T1BKW7_9STRA|nr:hypothetical protein PC117_g21085 [Phytophthora cactorum]KAG3210784.1 hypothetical protein PC129_g18230 [Phytophthora cactorum]
MLVCEEDGHFLNHQDTEKEDGMVATLVIQLPSTHEGGDLVIYRGGDVKYLHDFGKKEGTSAFLPHYAVHYADAEHALEKVTKLYRLVLVYSICLLLQMQHMKKNSDELLSEELTEAISTIGPEEESFALLLSHEYTEKSMKELGSGALKGIDRARFAALEDANLIVDKKLQFYIAEVKHEIHYCGNDGYEPSSWVEFGRENTATWYSTTGQRFGVKKLKMEMNFLNPGHESYYELWRSHGSKKGEGFTGNEGPLMDTTYSRYAIIAWPAAKAVEKALDCINTEAAIEILRSQKPSDADALRGLMNAVQPELEKKKKKWKWYSTRVFLPAAKLRTLSTEFCPGLCQLLVEARDVGLVKLFFSKIFTNFLLSEKTTMVPAIVSRLQAFEWNEVSNSFLGALGKLSDDECMLMALRVADNLTNEPARNSLVQLAVQNAAKVGDKLLDVSEAIQVVWAKSLKTLHHIWKMLVVQMARLLSWHRLHPNESRGCKIKSKGLDYSFSWEMPEAEIPENAKVQEFLRGPGTSMVAKDVVTFKSLQDARNYAAKSMRKGEVGASFVMEASEQDGTAFLTVTKTKAWFSKHQHLLLEYKKELDTLTDRYGDAIASAASKKARLEK